MVPVAASVRPVGRSVAAGVIGSEPSLPPRPCRAVPARLGLQLLLRSTHCIPFPRPAVCRPRSLAVYLSRRHIFLFITGGVYCIGSRSLPSSHERTLGQSVGWSPAPSVGPSATRLNVRLAEWLLLWEAGRLSVYVSACPNAVSVAPIASRWPARDAFPACFPPPQLSSTREQARPVGLQLGRSL